MRRQWFPNRLRTQLGADCSEHANAGRERKSITVNDAIQLTEQRGGFFFCQVKVHDLDIGSLTSSRESALSAKRGY